MLSSYLGRLNVVNALLELKADPNLLNDRHQSCLSGAIFKNELEIVQALLDHGADPDKGEPSAQKTAQIFGKGDIWDEKFQLARSALGAPTVQSNGLEGAGR